MTPVKREPGVVWHKSYRIRWKGKERPEMRKDYREAENTRTALKSGVGIKQQNRFAEMELMM